MYLYMPYESLRYEKKVLWISSSPPLGYANVLLHVMLRKFFRYEITRVWTFAMKLGQTII